MLWVFCAAAMLQETNVPAESGRHKSGLEITDVYVAATICEDVAVTRLALTIQNWDLVAREADLQFTVPKGAAVCEFDYEGAVNPDTEAILEAGRAKALYETLTAKAREITAKGKVRRTVRIVEPPARAPVPVRPDEAGDFKKLHRALMGKTSTLDDVLIEIDRLLAGMNGAIPRAAWQELLDLRNYIRGTLHAGPRINELLYRHGVLMPSPELLTQESDTLYRLRLFPIGPGEEGREVTATREGAVLNCAAPKRSQTAGPRQYADVFFVTRLKNGVYEFPIKIGGNVSKLPPIEVAARVVSCGAIESIRSDTDEIDVDGGRVSVKSRGEGTFRLKIRAAGFDGAHACADDVRYDMAWAERVLSTQDALKDKVVTRKTAILLAASDLYEMTGEEIPPAAPEKLLRVVEHVK